MARGNALDVLVRGPVTATKQYGDVSALDVSASHDPATGKQAVFIVNRSLTETVHTELVWQSVAPKSVTEANQLSGTDPKAANSWENPNVLVPKALSGLKIADGKLVISVPPLSFTAIGF